MRIRRTISSGIAASAIAVGCMVAGGAGFVATPAVAATAKSTCHDHSAKGKYPPPKCTAKTSKHKVKAGKKVKVKVGKKSFKKHEKVKEAIKCKGQKKLKLKTKKANKHGGLNGKVKIPKSSHGNCKLIFKGEKSHSKVTTHIKVKK